MHEALDVPAAVVTRGGVVESIHLAHIAVSGPDGPPVTIIGDPSTTIYPRSALKPLQTLAVSGQLSDHGITMDDCQLAITSSSHAGGDVHQIHAAALLAEAGLDETALRCPPSWPLDDHVIGQLSAPTTLSHNCSGKHAGMVWAHVSAGGDPATYLDLDTPLQERIQEEFRTVLDEGPQGPAIDGCGAPAWRCSLGALARGFARLARGADPALAAVRDAMGRHPQLVGGQSLPDTEMMWTDTRVVAKRGADGVMACAINHPQHGPLGVAVKVLDGGDRAAGPLAAAVLHALGANTAPASLRVPVTGGGVPQGSIAATPVVARTTTEIFGLS